MIKTMFGWRSSAAISIDVPANAAIVAITTASASTGLFHFVIIGLWGVVVTVTSFSL